jgi:PAS domain S-box-containing protein
MSERQQAEAALRQKAEAIAREKGGQSPEQLEALLPEETRQTLHDLRVHQIELEMQNEELRRAQVELDIARARYFDLYDLAAVGHCTLSEQGLILEANLTAAGLLGVSRSDLVKRRLTTFILPEDQGIYYRHRQQLFETGKPLGFELRMVKKDGTQFWARLEAIAANDEESTPVLRIVLTDITERKRSEDALHRSETKFRTLYDSTSDAVMLLNEKGFFDCNQATLTIFGCATREEFCSKHPVDLSPSKQPCGTDSLTLANQRIATAMKMGSNRFEWIYKKVNTGEPFYAEVLLNAMVLDGKPVVQAVVRDITERKLADEALRESKALMDAIVENVPLMIFLKEATDLRFVVFNRAGEDLLGYDRKDLLGKNNLDLFPPEQAANFMTKDREVLDGDAGMLDIPEEPILTAKKGQRLLHTRKVCIRGADGDTRFLLGISEDITERKQAEEALKKNTTLLHEMTTQVPGVVYQFYARPNGEMGFYYVSNGSEQVIGLKPHLEGFFERFAALVLPEYREGFIASIEKSVNESRAWNYEGILQKPTGEKIWFSGISTPSPRDNEIVFNGIVSDITERKRAEAYREMGREVLQILNEPGDLQDSIQRVLSTLKTRTGFDAVGIRLQDGDDFPYFAQKGFSEDFLLTENTLVERAADGGICRNEDGSACLECTCGLIISGKTDPTSPWFTQGGSCWTNDKADTPFEDTRLHPRNRCLHDGFQSVALVPIRIQNEIVGMIQLNDKRKGLLTLATIETLEGIASHIGAGLMRKRAEVNLACLSQKNELILRSAAEGILGLDLQGNHTFVNPAAAWMLGYEAADLIGRPSHGLWHHTKTDGSPCLVEECHFYDTFRSGTVYHSSVEVFWRKDGTSFPVEYASRPIYEQDRVVGAVVTFADITDRKLAEHQLNQSHNLLANLANAVPGVVYQYRLYPDGRSAFPYSSRGMNDIYEVTPEEVREDATPVFGRLHPDDYARVADSIQESARTLQTFYCEYRVILPRQGLRWRWSQAHPERTEDGGTLWHGIISDITDRKAVEEALRESEEKFSKAFQNASYAIAITRAEDGTFVEVNDAFITMTAFTREEALANSAIGLKLWVNEGDRQRAVAELRAGRAIIDQEYLFRTKSGKVITGLFSAQAIQLRHGPCILSSIGDITEQKVAQEALRESEERYRVLIENQGEGVGIVDTSEVFQFANPAAHRIFGVPTGNLVGRHLEEFVEPEDWQTIQDHSQERLDGLRSTYELNIVRPDGARCCLLVTGTPQLEANGVVSGTFGVFRDITDMKRAKEALRGERQRLAGIIEGTNAGTWEWNVQTGEAVFNDRWAEIIGYTLDEISPVSIETWMKFAHPDDLKASGELFEKHFRGDVDYYEFESRMKHMDGSWVWVLDRGRVTTWTDDGKPLLMQGTHQDITERKQAEETLRKSNELISLFISHSPIYTYIKEVTPTDSIVLQASDNFQQLIGIPGSKVVGKTMSELFPGEVGRKMIADDWAVVSKGSAQTLDENLNDRNYTTIKFPILQGDKTLLAGYTIDITDQKRMDKEKLELERRLLHGQKLESLGVLAGGIAHDFNNLLAAIIGNLSLVTDDLPELHTVRATVEQAMLAAEKAAELTRQMLAYSGKGHFQLKELNLNELVKENAQILKAVISKTVALDLQLGSELPKILVDSSQIQQVVMNLITNASEAIGDQAGSIIVTTGIDSCNETYLSRSRTAQKPEAGRFVWVEVRDTGCGMDEATQHRLFEPFFTTKFTGRGLGMSAVLGIVQGHGGALIINSEVGKGTNMRVLLPAVPTKADNISEDQITVPAVKSNAEQVRFSGTVLVVDDEEMIRGLCDAILSRLGFRVLQAVDGVEAMRIFQAHASVISAVIMDLTMPLMDGATAFKKMLQIKPDVKVILSSGYSEHDVSKNFSGQHPAGFLHKPYQLKTLKAELERVLKTSKTTSASVC